MFFPLIPILAIAAMIGGGVTLTWYSELSEKEKGEADRIACDYASDIYDKSIKELTNAEANHVASLTKRHFSA